jgi:hypothetical protein
VFVKFPSRASIGTLEKDGRVYPSPELLRTLEIYERTINAVDSGLAASQIANVASGGIASTDVQSAINELDSEKATTAALNAHLTDLTDVHVASAITNTPAGGIAATTVQAALNELDTEKATTASVTAAQAFAIQRANHTGTQLAATVSDFSAAADLRVAAAVGVSVQAYDSTPGPGRRLLPVLWWVRPMLRR